MQDLKITTDVCSIKGIKEENQDACGFRIPNGNDLKYKGVAIVIADGVSASSGAKDASNACVNGFLTDYYATPDSWSVKHCANKTISSLNNWLHSHSLRSDNNEVSNDALSMLSTLSSVVIKSNTAHIFHIGDSRIYLFRDNKLKQLTKDHSLVVSDDKTYLSRAMGFDLNVNIDYQTIDLQQNDKFLLTTDGVHDFIDAKTLEDFLKHNISATEITKNALNNKSVDNISAIVVGVEQLPDKNLDEALDELSKKSIPPDLSKGMKINGFEV